MNSGINACKCASKFSISEESPLDSNDQRKFRCCSTPVEDASKPQTISKGTHIIGSTVHVPLKLTIESPLVRSPSTEDYLNISSSGKQKTVEVRLQLSAESDLMVDATPPPKVDILTGNGAEWRSLGAISSDSLLQPGAVRAKSYPVRAEKVRITNNFDKPLVAKVFLNGVQVSDIASETSGDEWITFGGPRQSSRTFAIQDVQGHAVLGIGSSSDGWNVQSLKDGSFTLRTAGKDGLFLQYDVPSKRVMLGTEAMPWILNPPPRWLYSATETIKSNRRCPFGFKFDPTQPIAQMCQQTCQTIPRSDRHGSTLDGNVCHRRTRRFDISRPAHARGKFAILPWTQHCPTGWSSPADGRCTWDSRDVPHALISSCSKAGGKVVELSVPLREFDDRGYFIDFDAGSADATSPALVECVSEWSMSAAFELARKDEDWPQKAPLDVYGSPAFANGSYHALADKTETALLACDEGYARTSGDDRALCEVGDSEWENITDPVVCEELPHIPQRFEFLGRSDARIKVSWSHRAWPGAGDVQYYFLGTSASFYDGHWQHDALRGEVRLLSFTRIMFQRVSNRQKRI